MKDREESVERTASDQRWWRLYRQERARLGLKKRDKPNDGQIVRAAREAQRRFAEERAATREETT